MGAPHAALCCTQGACCHAQAVPALEGCAPPLPFLPSTHNFAPIKHYLCAHHLARRFTPTLTSENDLRRLMTYSRRFVQTLTLRQLPSHMDLGIIFDCMVSSPSALAVHYNLHGVGMEYDRSLFGMKLSDCRWVGVLLFM